MRTYKFKIFYDRRLIECYINSFSDEIFIVSAGLGGLGCPEKIPIDKISGIPIYQFTGHFDRHGNEIYEGHKIMEIGDSRTYTVEWQDDLLGFYRKYPDGSRGNFVTYLKNIEIIGHTAFDKNGEKNGTY